MEAENVEIQRDGSYPDDILRAAAEAARDGSAEAIAQALLAERKRCAEIARTITQQEAKVVIKSARLEYWEDFGCHVQAGERYRINFKDAIARKIMHSPAELSPPSDTNPTEGR
jgi:hypothetical protein